MVTRTHLVVHPDVAYNGRKRSVNIILSRLSNFSPANRLSGKESEMKYICFGYLDGENWEKKSESERHALIDECLTYDDALRRNGNWVSGEGLQAGAVTLRYKKGQVTVTDG